MNTEILDAMFYYFKDDILFVFNNKLTLIIQSASVNNGYTLKFSYVLKSLIQLV